MTSYAVFGNPISHSQSPFIHRAFAAQTKQSLTYEPILAPVAGFEQALRDFMEKGGLGCNVTIPFKQQAWQLTEHYSAHAKRAGAVNTLSFRDGQIHGTNTDGIGLVRDLRANHGVGIAGKRVLLLGAGGAVRGVLVPLLAEQPALLQIANRTAKKAIDLACDFAEFGTIKGGGYTEIEGAFDLIINATAASLHSEIPPLAPHCLTAESCCYDMMYGKEPTLFLEWAKQQGVKQTIDGLGMLVEQAAESFFIWRQVRPDTQAVLAKLRMC